MGRSTKPRKAYNPRYKGKLPIVYGMSREIKDELAIAPLMAISMFTSGHGSEDLAYTIINSILLGYRLARDEADLKLFFAGSDAMKRVLARGAEGKWGFSGEDLQEIKAAVALSDELQEAATGREMREAVQAILANADSY